MKLVFLTNFINHHQVPIADEFYSNLGDDYKFIATMRLTELRRNLGYPEYEDRKYLFNAYVSKENEMKAIQLINEADVVIVGGVNYLDKYLKERLKQKKLIFRYSERWLKEKWKLIDYPRKLKQHKIKMNENVHLLAASAYMPNDMRLLCAYSNKIYKWGYFTEVNELDILKILEEKRNEKIKILWCARFIDWKHPRMVPELAKYLKEWEYDFEINMVGSGPLLSEIEKIIQQYNLKDYINILGVKPNKVVLELMRENHIFIFTSDRNEGWGAVLNEAMSNGCAVVASHEIGSVPFLIENNKNGLIFKSKCNESLAEKVEYLIENQELREEMTLQAYETMKITWSPKNASKQFLELANAILHNRKNDIRVGPCSKANIQPTKYNF